MESGIGSHLKTSRAAYAQQGATSVKKKTASLAGASRIGAGTDGS